jgi:uncharacterized protein (TIGR03382 family)
MRASEPLPTIGPHDLNPNPNSEVHNAGEIWAAALWESYVGLQDAGTSFDDVRHAMARYVVAGMQMMPSDATPLEARDALVAVAAASRPDDARIIAEAFARRGFGSCAQAAPRDSTTFDEIVESTTTNGELVVAPATLDDSVANCDHDGILDVGETARITVPVSNRGFAPLHDVTATLVSTTPGFVVTSAPVAVPSLDPGATMSLVFDVTLQQPATEVDYAIQLATPDGCTMQTVVSDAMRANANDVPASSPVDTFDAASVWQPQPHSEWTLARHDGIDRYWHEPARGALVDEVLVSPPITADATLPATIAFTHRHAFDPDDGAVVEYTADGGATWADLATLGVDAGYTGIVASYGSALDGRPGFVGASPGYPATTAVTIQLGTRLAGKTFQLRFRFASSAHRFLSDVAPGWDLEMVGVTNAGTPFPSSVPDPGACSSGSGSDAGGDDTGPPPGGGGCCETGSPPTGAALGALLVMLGRRRRGRR